MDFDTSQVIHKVKTLNLDLNLETPFECKNIVNFCHCICSCMIITFQDANTTKVSVLDIFDPLTESGEDEEEEEEIYWSSKKSTSNFSESFYDTHDPFSYMQQQAELASRLEEVKDEELGLGSDNPDEAPPRPLMRLQRSQLVGVVRPISYADEKTLLQRKKTKKNYETIVKDFSKATIARKPCIAMDSDVESFIDMVLEVRRLFPCSDTTTNPGFVEAAKLEAEYPPDTQVSGLHTNSWIICLGLAGETGDRESGLHNVRQHRDRAGFEIGIS